MYTTASDEHRFMVEAPAARAAHASLLPLSSPYELALALTLRLGQSVCPGLRGGRPVGLPKWQTWNQLPAQTQQQQGNFESCSLLVVKPTNKGLFPCCHPCSLFPACQLTPATPGVLYNTLYTHLNHATPLPHTHPHTWVASYLG